MCEQMVPQRARLSVYTDCWCCCWRCAARRGAAQRGVRCAQYSLVDETSIINQPGTINNLLYICSAAVYTAIKRQYNSQLAICRSSIKWINISKCGRRRECHHSITHLLLIYHRGRLCPGTDRQTIRICSLNQSKLSSRVTVLT